MTAPFIASQRVGVVIPILNPGPGLDTLIAALNHQDPRPPDTIMLVDSGSGNAGALTQAANVHVTHIDRFTHGGSRNHGAGLCDTDIVVFVTQDALPADSSWLRNLVEPLRDAAVSAVYGRQLPTATAPPTERFFLARRFPPVSARKHLDLMGSRAMYEQATFSNVNSAVRKSVLDVHPFDETLIMGEDLQLAVELLEADHTLVYAADACVLHAHHYSVSEVFRRYFDSVYALSRIFRQHTTGSDARLGIRYCLVELPFVLRTRPAYLPRYILDVLAKACATLLARRADRLPRALLRRLSMHPGYWPD